MGIYTHEPLLFIDMTADVKFTKNFSIRLNSGGLCFICLKDTKAKGGDHSHPPTSFRLRNITRFLEIDTKEILKAYLDYDLKRCSDVKVELCEGCSEQVQKFNCLYQSLELTKLKLNDCAQKISSLIKEAEKECDDEGTREMEIRVTHAATKGVIVDLRAGISEKCLEFSETVLPRVILKRLPEYELAKFSSRKRVVAIGSTTESTPIKVEVSDEDDESSSSIDNATTAASEISDSDSDTESVISREQGQTQIKSRFRISSKSFQRDGKFPCPLCKAVLVEKQHLQVHLVIYHLQAYFFPEDDHKEPSLSSGQFSQLVHHLVESILTEHPVPVEVWRCPHCPKTFVTNNVAYFKLHVIENHRGPLVQRLSQLQTDPILLEQVLKTTKTWVCECGDHFSTARTYITHHLKFCSLLGDDPTVAKRILQIHQQQLKSSISQSPDGTLQASCFYCRAVFANQNRRSRNKLEKLVETHLTAFHLHTFFPEEDLKESSLSSSQFQQVIHHQLFTNISAHPENVELLQCPNCNETTPRSKMSRLKMHVIKCHNVALVQRLKELQRDSVILKKLSKISKEYICDCGAYCSNSNLYTVHRSKFCNFIEKTPKNGGMSPELSKQYSEIVDQQINSSISKCENGTVQKSCSHCRAVFRSRTLSDLRVLTWDHLGHYHLHTFFPEDKHKDSSLSSLQFKQVIHHFLFENIISDRDTKTNKTSYKCPHCVSQVSQVTIPRVKISRVKLHLIKHHYSSLVRRLEELQKDALIFEKLGKVRKGFPCKCGDYFMSIQVSKVHREKFCNQNGNHVKREIAYSPERDLLELDDEEKFEAVDFDDHFIDSGDMSSMDIGEVKPSICTGTSVGEEEEVGESERKRRRSELDSGSNSPETSCVPQKLFKLE